MSSVVRGLCGEQLGVTGNPHFKNQDSWFTHLLLVLLALKGNSSSNIEPDIGLKEFEHWFYCVFKHSYNSGICFYLILGSFLTFWGSNGLFLGLG